MASSDYRLPKSYSLCFSGSVVSGVSRNCRSSLHCNTFLSDTRCFMYFSSASCRSLISAGDREPKYFFGGNSGSCWVHAQRKTTPFSGATAAIYARKRTETQARARYRRGRKGNTRILARRAREAHCDVRRTVVSSSFSKYVSRAASSSAKSLKRFSKFHLASL